MRYTGTPLYTYLYINNNKSSNFQIILVPLYILYNPIDRICQVLYKNKITKG